MNSTICSRCRAALRLPALRQPSVRFTRQSSSSSSGTASSSPSELATLLSKPTWSVRSLLPTPSSSSTSTEPSTTITPETLRHLLRLSALPPPVSADEESQMLSTLESQLGFVRAVREVDTAGVEPLRAIRDETTLGLDEQTIGPDDLKEALDNEVIVGHARRPRRRRGESAKDDKSADSAVENWDVLAGASETAGRYFVVRSASSSQVQPDISQARDAKVSC
ncbi:hypothetical protein GGR52DRAFT_39445 [Hypoxylon sp. FL1284]|nr:hypothetical protein GGR52DRAFT_39445 [Hypoxylon sp. FL1284]